MASRLRKMILVNARTSGTLTSGVINELDPRGGAAITGDNAVGKTTTLKLLPLFFGTPPSQIDPSDSGRMPMLRFVLPDPGCALVFEYQRGAEDRDTHCVVIRRQEASDAPEYRFVSGPFNRRYFVGSLEDGGAEVFLDDGGMKDAAERLGAVAETKLTSAQYRAVIQNLRPTTQDAKTLRRLSAQYSFSQRGLANLDRLIAAVVKEKINFRDFTTVAVAMAQAPEGQMGASKAEPERIALRQKKTQIDTWLRNRDSCAAAIALGPRMLQLRTELDTVVKEEGFLAQRRADVEMLIDARRAEVIELKSDCERLEADARRLDQEEDAKQQHLDEASKSAGSTHAQAQAAYQAEQARFDRMQKAGAAQWAERVVALPSLRNERQAVGQQAEVALGAAKNVEETYQVLVGKIELAAGRTISELEGQKQQRQGALQLRIADIAVQEREELKLVDAGGAERREVEKGKLHELSKQEGRAEEALRNPASDRAFTDRVEAASGALNDASNDVSVSTRQQAEADGKLREANAAFGRAEMGVVAAREGVARAERDLSDAKRALAPADGTLLSALRASPNQQWRTNLAKILDPALLHQQDLDAVAAEGSDSDALAFGWSMDLSGLKAPDWTDDSALRDRVAQCEDMLTRAKDAERSALATRESASKARQVADEAKANADAHHSVVERRQKALASELEVAKQARKSAERSAKEKAERALDEVKQQIRKEQGEAASEEAKWARIRKDVELEYKRRQEAAELECKADLEKIDKAIEAQKKQSADQIGAVILQRDEELRGRGVDVGRITQLQERLSAIDLEIAEMERRMPLVDEWRAWLDGGGQNSLENALLAESTAGSAARKAKDEASKFLDASTKSKRARATAMGQAAESLVKRKAEVSSLESLRDRYPGTVARTGSGLSKEAGFEEIKGLIDDQAAKVRVSEDTVARLHREVRFALTKNEGAVKDLVEAELAALPSDASERHRAHYLCTVHSGIASQIVAPLNQELMLVLETVSQFQKQIAQFESEISEFNKRLQTGLRNVCRFERLKEVELRVTTDFGALGIMDKLKMLIEPYAEHKLRMQSSAGFNTELPPESASQALRHVSLALGGGSTEVDLAQYVHLAGSVNENGNVRRFARDSELQNISSTGLSALIMTTLLTGMVNVIRGSEKVYLPWTSDEIGKFDGGNFAALMATLQENLIDVVTASPAITPVQSRQFAQRYQFGERGLIGVYKPPMEAMGAAA